MGGSNTNGTVSVINAKTGKTLEAFGGFSGPIASRSRRTGSWRSYVTRRAMRYTWWTSQRESSAEAGWAWVARGVTIVADGRTAFVTLAQEEPSESSTSLSRSCSERWAWAVAGWGGRGPVSAVRAVGRVVVQEAFTETTTHPRRVSATKKTRPLMTRYRVPLDGAGHFISPRIRLLWLLAPNRAHLG